MNFSYTVPKKEISEFNRNLGNRIESAVLSEAMDKAIKYLDRDELPVHWERATLFDLHIPDSDSDENYSDVSDIFYFLLATSNWQVIKLFLNYMYSC